MEDQEQIIIEKKSPVFTKIILAVVISATIFGLIGYVLGQQHASNAPETPAVQTAIIESSEVASPETTSTATEATWKTYTNDGYGFSFKYPASWIEYNPGGNAGDDFAVFFKNPEIKATTEGENADPYAIQNIFVRVYSKTSSDSLADWLTTKFRGMGGELSGYNVGEKIQMAGLSGYVSDIGCCGGHDKSYVVEKDGKVFGIGTFSSEKYMMLPEIARTFQFSK